MTSNSIIITKPFLLSISRHKEIILKQSQNFQYLSVYDSVCASAIEQHIESTKCISR